MDCHFGRHSYEQRHASLHFFFHSIPLPVTSRIWWLRDVTYHIGQIRGRLWRARPTENDRDSGIITRLTILNTVRRYRFRTIHTSAASACTRDDDIWYNRVGRGLGCTRKTSCRRGHWTCVCVFQKQNGLPRKKPILYDIVLIWYDLVKRSSSRKR